MKFDRVIFLDRDGVINQDSPEYIKNWDEFKFLPGSLDALRLLSQAGYGLIVTTNQSIINRGWVPQSVLDHTHSQMCASVAEAGGRIDDIFFCPHRPDENCACRKPKHGMILKAQQRYGLDLTDTIMIGDSAKDILSGRNAGCGNTILVQTGNGPTALEELRSQGIAPDFIAADLLDAARLILSNKR